MSLEKRLDVKFSLLITDENTMELMNHDHWRALFTNPREELMDYIHDLEAMDDQSEAVRLPLLYAKVTHAYLQSDLPNLEKLVLKLEELKDQSKLHELIFFMARLRLSTREWKLDTNSIDQIHELVKEFHLLKGEAFYIGAFHLSRFEKGFEARKLFLLSATGYRKSKIHTKEILATLNAITADKNLNPEKIIISDLRAVLRKSEKYKNRQLIGMVNLNLAEEFKQIESYGLAWKHLQDALEHLETPHHTWHYLNAVGMFVTMAMKLNHHIEAKEGLEILKASPLKEAKTILAEIKDCFPEIEGIDVKSEINSLPWWKLTLREDAKKLSKSNLLGEELIDFLMEGPKSKKEIIAKLYGDKMDYHSLENRFKVLLSRVRKKVPGLILLRNDKCYELSEAVLKGEKKAC